MKKILVLISNFNGVGGAETATYRFLSRIDRGKFQVDVCFFGFEDGFVQSVRQFVNSVFCINVKKHGYFSSYYQILKRVWEQKYEIIHTHLALADLYGLFLTFLAPFKWITTEHNLSDRRKVTLPGRFYYRLAGWRAHAVVGVSGKIIDRLHSFGVSEKKLVRIPNPVELGKSNQDGPSKIEFLRAWGWPGDSVIIGTVANLRPVKGLRYLIDALKVLIDEGFNPRLVIAGEGPERAGLERRIADLGLTGYVVMLGYRNDVYRLLPVFDIYVSPSVSEGFGISIVEAMAAGLPVVSTNAGGVTDFLKHKVNAYLVDPQDPLALAEGISYLINHEAEAAQIASRAKNGAKQFETGNLVKYLERLYLGEPLSFEQV